MIRARIEELVRELRTPDGRSRTHIGHAAARVEIADRLAQLLAEEEGGWRPIETAPRIGKNILVIRVDLRGNYGPMIARSYATWKPEAWQLESGRVDHGGMTHWQPLPEPPPGPRP